MDVSCMASTWENICRLRGGWPKGSTSCKVLVGLQKALVSFSFTSLGVLHFLNRATGEHWNGVRGGVGEVMDLWISARRITGRAGEL